MKKKRMAVLALFLAAVVVAQAGCVSLGRTSTGEDLAALRGSGQSGISVSGEGKVMATPDVATLSLGVEARAKTVADAQQQAAKAMDAVMSSLTGNGVDKKDIKTQYFNVRQDIRTVNQVQTIDYVVSNSVTAKIRKVADVGKIIDASVAAGGDLARVQSVSFNVDDQTPFLNQAREKAVADAKAKADQLARLAGVKLGNPASISESGGATAPRPLALPAAADSKGGGAQETSISPGEMQITLNVQVRYTIE